MMQETSPFGFGLVNVSVQPSQNLVVCRSCTNVGSNVFITVTWSNIPCNPPSQCNGKN